MKILFITLDPVESSSSAMTCNLGIIDGLVGNGHSVSILSIQQNVNQRSNEKSWYSNIEVIRLKSSKLYNSIESKKNNNHFKIKIRKFIRGIYKRVSIYNNTYIAAKKFNPDILKNKTFDIVISASDPKTSHIVLNKLKKSGFKSSRWIQYWGDPLSIDISNLIIWPKWFVRLIEYNLIKSADSIIYVSPFTLIEQQRIFKSLRQKMKFVPIPYIKSKSSRNDYNIESNSLLITYLGSYYSNIRNIKPLYNSFNMIDSNIKMIIAGPTDLNLESNNNISILPTVGADLVNKFEEECNAYICLLNKNGTQIPGKIYYYSGTDKPIIVIIDGELGHKIKNYLERFNRYIFCENNEQSIAEAIKSISKFDKYKPVEFLESNFVASKIIDVEDNFYQFFN